MTLAMTTKEILIAAKGEINLQNRPEAGANSNRELNFYTVISHPDPKNDPTIPVGGVPAPPTIKSITSSQAGVTITWDGGAVLQGSDKVNGPYTDNATARSPFTTAPAGTARFYRLKN